MAVLDGDLFEIDVDDVHHPRVLRTYFEGRVVCTRSRPSQQDLHKVPPRARLPISMVGLGPT